MRGRRRESGRRMRGKGCKRGVKRGMVEMGREDVQGKRKRE